MSVINGYRYLINEGGVRSLWRGNGMNVLKIIPETALRFSFFEEVTIYDWFLFSLTINQIYRYYLRQKKL